MPVEQKSTFFWLLVQCGFKEIEVAYPAASDTDFGFVRGLVEKKEIPDDVWIQVIELNSNRSFCSTSLNFRSSRLQERI